jgi:hypothetical protein
VRVGDQTLSTSQVAEVTAHYCDGLEPQLKANGAAFPMSYVRAYVVRNLTLRAAAQQLAEHYGIKLPPSYDQAVRDLRSQLSGVREDRLDDVVEVESVGLYVQAVETAVGGLLLDQAGTSGADDKAKQARGQDALQQWLSEHPADVNPLYGISVADTSLRAPTFVDTGTSYPVSANAVAGAKKEPDQAYAATLPENQRCG